MYTYIHTIHTPRPQLTTGPFQTSLVVLVSHINRSLLPVHRSLLPYATPLVTLTHCALSDRIQKTEATAGTGLRQGCFAVWDRDKRPGAARRIHIEVDGGEAGRREWIR